MDFKHLEQASEDKEQIQIFKRENVSFRSKTPDVSVRRAKIKKNILGLVSAAASRGKGTSAGSGELPGEESGAPVRFWERALIQADRQRRGQTEGTSQRLSMTGSQPLFSH